MTQLNNGKQISSTGVNGHIDPRHVAQNSLPASGDARQVGPVTMATGGAAALTALVAGTLERFGIPLTALEQGSLTVCFIMLAGWAVYPKGRRSL